MDEPDSGESENDRLTVLPYATPATPAASDGGAIIRRHVLMSAIAAFVVVGNLYLLGSGAIERFQAWMLVATDLVIAIGVPTSFAAAKPGVCVCFVNHGVVRWPVPVLRSLASFVQ